jgi:hypothetical protein
VPLLWPFSDRYFLFYPWFPHVARYSGSSQPIEFFLSLLNPHNAWAATVEILTLGPPVALLIWWRRRNRPDPQEPDTQEADTQVADTQVADTEEPASTPASATYVPD